LAIKKSVKIRDRAPLTSNAKVSTNKVRLPEMGKRQKEWQCDHYLAATYCVKKEKESK